MSLSQEIMLDDRVLTYRIGRRACQEEWPDYGDGEITGTMVVLVHHERTRVIRLSDGSVHGVERLFIEWLEENPPVYWVQPSAMYACDVRTNDAPRDERGCMGPARDYVGVCEKHGGPFYTWNETKELLR